MPSGFHRTLGKSRPIVFVESNRNEDNVSYDHMPLYEEDKSELGLREFIEASEDDEDEFYGKRDI